MPRSLRFELLWDFKRTHLWREFERPRPTSFSSYGPILVSYCGTDADADAMTTARLSPWNSRAKNRPWLTLTRECDGSASSERREASAFQTGFVSWPQRLSLGLDFNSKPNSELVRCCLTLLSLLLLYTENRALFYIKDSSSTSFLVSSLFFFYYLSSSSSFWPVSPWLSVNYIP